jgi:hypothetical protein
MITELYEATCRTCRRTFDPIDSDACRMATYCGRDCELEAIDCGPEGLHSVQDEDSQQVP